MKIKESTRTRNSGKECMGSRAICETKTMSRAITFKLVVIDDRKLYYSITGQNDFFFIKSWNCKLGVIFMKLFP